MTSLVSSDLSRLSMTGHLSFRNKKQNKKDKKKIKDQKIK
jgi:hypothetical protein